MISIKITTEKDHSWSTRFNGSLEEANTYFINKYFDCGIFPREDMQKAVKVELI